MERSFFEWVSFLLDQYGNLFLRGTINTIIIAILGTVFGFFIGMLVAVLKTIPVESGDSKTKKFFHKAIDILFKYLYTSSQGHAYDSAVHALLLRCPSVFQHRYSIYASCDNYRFGKYRSLYG